MLKYHDAKKAATTATMIKALRIHVLLRDRPRHH
jgi:hypothetical protein